MIPGDNCNSDGCDEVTDAFVNENDLKHSARAINDCREYYNVAGNFIICWGGDNYYNISWIVDDD